MAITVVQHSFISIKKYIFNVEVFLILSINNNSFYLLNFAVISELILSIVFI
jgi:hypothetical protein